MELLLRAAPLGAMSPSASVQGWHLLFVSLVSRELGRTPVLGRKRALPAVVRPGPSGTCRPRRHPGPCSFRRARRAEVSAPTAGSALARGQWLPKLRMCHAHGSRHWLSARRDAQREKTLLLRTWKEKVPLLLAQGLPGAASAGPPPGGAEWPGLHPTASQAAVAFCSPCLCTSVLWTCGVPCVRDQGFPLRV